MIQVINTIIALLVIMAVGWFAGKSGMASGDIPKSIARLLFNVTLPCTIIVSMQFEVAPDFLIKCGHLIMISTAVTILGMGVGWLFSIVFGVRTYFKRIMICAMGFSNFSFMGYPVVEAVYGPEGLMYAAVFTLPCFILVQSLGNAILSNDGKFSLKKLINPPTVAVFIGFALFLATVRLPDVVHKSLSLLGALTTPMSMILVGILIRRAPFGRVFHEWRYFVLSALRLIILPLVVYTILSAIGWQGIMLGIPVLITMMPVAANIIISVANFDGDTDAAANLTMISTFFSLITIPLMIYFLQLG